LAEGAGAVTGFYVDDLEISYFSASCSTPSVHHYEIVHDGQGLTCEAEPITIKACMNSDCSTLSSDSISLDFQADGVTKSSPTFTGSTVLNLSQTSEIVDLTLGINNATVAATNSVVCDDGSGNSCDIDFADAAFIFSQTSEANVDIDNQVSGTSFTTYIRAVENVDGVCTGLFNGNVTVGLSQKNVSPGGTGGLLFTVDDASSITQSLDKHETFKDVELTFNGSSEALLTNATYLDAGQIQLYASYNSGGVSLVGNSNTFWVSPAKLVATAKSGGSDIDGNNNTSTTRHKAGVAFDFTVTAVNSFGETTENYSPNDLEFLLTRTGPTGGGTDGNFSYEVGSSISSSLTPSYQNVTLSTFGSGTFSTDSAFYSEVGLLNLDIRDVDYGFSSNTIAGDDINIGRFYPDHFDVSVTANSFANTCTTATEFTYIGQDFTYLLPPVLTIIAKNSAGETTENYTESDYQKLVAGDIDRTFPTADSAKDGADDTTKMIVTPDVSEGDLEPSETSAGELTYTFKDTDSYVYSKDTNAEVSEFSVAYDISVTDISDSDNVAINSATSLPLLVSPSAGLQRYGRMYIENSFGPESANLPIKIYTQYIDNTDKFVTNTDDSCSALLHQDGGTENLSLTNISLNPALSGVNDLDSAFSNGYSEELQLSAPGYGNQGELGVSYEAPTWLKYDWDGDGDDDNPEAIATFGLFRGNDRIIYWREVGN